MGITSTSAPMFLAMWTSPNYRNVYISMSKIASPKKWFCVAVAFCMTAKPANRNGLWPPIWSLAYAAARRKILTDFVWRTMPFSIKAHSRVAEDGSISFIRKFLCGLRPRPSGRISPHPALPGGVSDAGARRKAQKGCCQVGYFSCIMQIVAFSV